MNKTLEGMARASVDADGCDGDYDKNPPEIREALAVDMKRVLLWLADNVSDEMVEAAAGRLPHFAKVADVDVKDAILSALRSAGWAVVPVEPTNSMELAASEHDMNEIEVMRKIWRAMLSASEGEL